MFMLAINVDQLLISKILRRNTNLEPEVFVEIVAS